MTQLRDRLQSADPIPREMPLSTTEVQRMRQTIIGAVEQSRPALSERRRTAWTVAAIAAVIAVVGMERWLERTPPPLRERSAGTDVDVAQTSSPRQMQFQTPGGTRVIWIFNPDFRP